MVRGPGNRPPSDESGCYVAFDSDVLCYSPNGNCLLAVLFNALYALNSYAAAIEMLGKGRVAAQSRAYSRPWLENSMSRYALSANQSCTTGPSSKIMGVFLMRLEGRDGHDEVVEHDVAVDAARRLILDCAEEKVMRLEAVALDVCVGDGFHFTKVLEHMEMVKQKAGKEKRKSHKMSKEKPKDLRGKKRAIVSEVRSRMHHKREELF